MYQNLLGILLLAWVFVASGKSGGDAEILRRADTTPEVGTASSATSTVYLPLIAQPGTFTQNHVIWAHASTPAPHEVVLFRHTFALAEQLESVQLSIFADTRYEVWVDGVWVGRGPARFSRTRREYDIYQLSALHPGVHLIAVLVQWAPNVRRAESDTPLLLSHIRGVTSQGRYVTARTGPQWKALLSRAWRQDAVPVHSWGLIGPTELVDLQQLPRDWMLPAFSDDEWPAAVVKGLPDETAYLPRSIPLLTSVPFTPTVIDTGLLSPGRAVGELGPSMPDPYVFPFEISKPTEFVVEILTGTETLPSGTVLLDNNNLDWKAADVHRPDVYIASTTVDTGAHSLSFADIPLKGLTFGVSVQDIQSATLPFQQGVHAGRRLLLAEPVSQTGVVSISSGEGMTVEFTTTPAYAVLDLGRVIHGRLTASSIGPAGTVVDIGWDERLLPGTLRPLPYPGSLHAPWNQTDSWVLDGTLRSISTIDARAGRYVLIAAWGDSPIQVGGIRVYEERYPVFQRGSFTSSNQLLNEIWQIGVDTLYPNMTDAYTDTPWRERGQWWGDAYVSNHINRVVFGDTRLLRRGLLFMAEAFVDGRPPALAPNSDSTLLLDYGMLWVQSVYDWHQVTGDIHLLVQVYPVLREFLAYLEGYENPNTGLLDIPFGHWWEAALIDWAGPYNRYGQSTAINSLYSGTLMDASSIADATGNAGDALVWRQKADSVKQQVNAHLYLPTLHQYASSIFQGETLSPTVHAQAWPLAYGLVPGQEVDPLVSSLLELPSEVEMYGMFWVLEALGSSDHISEALEMIETYYEPLLDLGATTWWEVSYANTRYASSLSHTYGGGPTWFLTTYVLGARQLGPDTWSVRPAFRGVDYASGSLPLPDGELKVHWEHQSCEESQLMLSAPTTTTGEIVIPFTNETAALILNGHVVWREGTALTPDIVELADGIHIPLQGGNHTLNMHQSCDTTTVPAN